MDVSSVSRYNGGIKTKRAYGSATITVFLCSAPDLGNPSIVRYVYIAAHGPTSGERATVAKRAAKPYVSGEVPIPPGNSEGNPIKAYPVKQT